MRFLQRLLSSWVQVWFSIFSKRLINLRPACCLLALSRKVERISKRPSLIPPVSINYDFFWKATRVNYCKWVHHLVQNLWSLGELLLLIIKSFVIDLTILYKQPALFWAPFAYENRKQCTYIKAKRKRFWDHAQLSAMMPFILFSGTDIYSVFRSAEIHVKLDSGGFVK